MTTRQWTDAHGRPHSPGAQDSALSQAASGISRRRFVHGAAGLLLPATWSANEASAAAIKTAAPGRGPEIPKWPEPGQTRQIWLRREATGETVVARYFENGAMRMPDYFAVCSLLRDVQSGVIAHIDVELMDLVFAIQNWLVSWGVDIPMIVLSGYRTKAFNARTEGAALNSMHVQGRATDVHMPGVPPAYLGRLASIFSVGGVGFYRNRNFIHLDTGSVRYWGSR